MDKNPGCCSTDGHPHPFSYSSTIPSSTVYYQVVSSSTPSANGKQLRMVTVPPGNDGRHGGRNDQDAECFSMSSSVAVRGCFLAATPTAASLSSVVVALAGYSESSRVRFDQLHRYCDG